MKSGKIPKSIPEQGSLHSQTSENYNSSFASNAFDYEQKLQDLNIQAIEPIDSYSSFVQQDQIVHVQSKIWPQIYYFKKSIRELLDERIKICQLYKLNFKKKNEKTLKQTRQHVTKEQLLNTIMLIFDQSPSSSQYDEVSFTFVQSSFQTFIFFSTDQKYIPQCKKCNFSVYIVVDQRKNTKQKINSKGNIICSNTKCKKHILGDFQIKQVISQKNNESFSNKKIEIKSNKQQQKQRQQKEEQVKNQNITEENKLQIKKAIKKLFK